MQKNYTQLLLGIVIGLVAGFLIAKFTLAKNEPKQIISPVNYPTQNNNSNNRTQNRVDVNNGEGNFNGNENIPAKVTEVLKYIKTNNAAMDGYVGGREFTNRQNVLPINNTNGTRIRYQEWDVNPKVQGQNRGTQRLCTGDDGRSWYTSDHYKSFTEVK